MSEIDKLILRLQRKIAELRSNASLNAENLSKASVVSNLTGLHVVALNTLNLKGVDDDTTYEINESLCRSYIRLRVDGGKLPTTYELYDSLMRMDLLGKMDIRSFRKFLLKMDFIWKKTRGGVPVVIEKPIVRFERFFYLSQIRQHRSKELENIYFVDELAYNQTMFMDLKESIEAKYEKWQVRVIHAVGKRVIVCPKELKEFNAELFEDWIENELIPCLPEPSVIVVKDIEHHNRTLIERPTLRSSRYEMMRWLDHFNIPYGDDVSKYELFSLAEELTDLNNKLYKIDTILNIHGHYILRIPKTVLGLNPAEMFFNHIKEQWKFESSEGKTSTAVDILKAKLFYENLNEQAMLHLEEYSESVSSNEVKMFFMEKKVDKILDGLMKKHYSQRNEDSEVPSCSDSD